MEKMIFETLSLALDIGGKVITLAENQQTA